MVISVEGFAPSKEKNHRRDCGSVRPVNFLLDGGVVGVNGKIKSFPSPLPTNKIVYTPLHLNQAIIFDKRLRDS